MPSVCIHGIQNNISDLFIFKWVGGEVENRAYNQISVTFRQYCLKIDMVHFIRPFTNRPIFVLGKRDCGFFSMRMKLDDKF
jgi:hypothetical protein